MIAYLKGDFTRKNPTTIWIDVQGVGYEVHISLNTYEQLQNLEKGIVYTVAVIREDAHLLYGFFDLREKELFQQLISVSGVGASTARVMLSYMKPEEISRSILQGDSRQLESIKGIGKKTAERIVLELRDKLAKNAGDINIPALKNNSLQQDALNALTALGINKSGAEQALKKVLEADPGLPVEELVKRTLRIL